MGRVYDKVYQFRWTYGKGLTFRYKKHAKVVEEYLDYDEEVSFAFAAQKNGSSKEFINTFVVALTNKRLVLGRKRLLWGSFFYTITPDMYNDMRIYKGIFWGKVTIDTIKEEVVLSNLPKRGLDAIETAISEYMMEEKKKYKKRDDEVSK